MKPNYLFVSLLILCFIKFPLSASNPVEAIEASSGYADTVHITRGGNYYHLSKKVLGISHIHFLGKGMKCIDDISPELSGLFKADNNMICDSNFLIKPDTSIYHTNAVLFDSYFEDVSIESGENGKSLILQNTITYIPNGDVRYEVIHFKKQPFIIAKANIDGILYVEWFSSGSCRRNTFYTINRYAFRGISTGVLQAARGMGIGGKNAARGFIVGGKGAALGGKHGGRGALTGLEGFTLGIGKAIYNESKMFYRPSSEIEDMGDLIYEEKAIDVEENITIYTYYFRSKSPKANLFLVHGNGGNVSTYKNMIQTLVSGNYNVYVVDWRGYGKSTGKPGYKGLLKDTEAAFDDFISMARQDSLQVIVYGMSMGGQLATKLVSDRQQEVDAFVLDGSLSSAQNLAMDFMPGKLIRNSMKKSANTFNQDYVAERDIQKIINTPKLIIHSAMDNIILLYHGERLFKNAQHPKFFWKTNTQHIKTLEELPDKTISQIDKLINYAKH